ncbi:MAG: thioredoxin family protein [Hymenobacteraceae bacterium]|nr:thioredoxin family protein [Hymenobacteraceae bacterium]
MRFFVVDYGPRVGRGVFGWVLLASCLLTVPAVAQLVVPTTWSFRPAKPVVKVGEEVELIFSVKIQPDWYLYSSDFDPDLGPIVTTVSFAPHPSYQLVGKLAPQHPKKKFDDTWGGEYTYFVGTAEFRQKVKVLASPVVIKGTYEGQSCSEKSGQCVPLSGAFAFDVGLTPGPSPKGEGRRMLPPTGKANAAAVPPASGAPVVASVDSVQPAVVASQPVTVDPSLSDSATAAKAPRSFRRGAEGEAAAAPVSLWSFLLGAFGAGLLALLTPCVYPLIPMTVSLFTNSGDSRGRGIFKAAVYGLSIIAIYTFVGVLVVKVLGEEGPNFIATHWAPNLLFFAVFVVFGLSFLGLFELTLPSSFVNKVDQQADKGGWAGLFFMATTLVVVSFSCTGPIVGSLLALASRGQTLLPALGMMAFGLAFALPFTLFAIFPTMLKSLPRSGGWLNVVKVTLGFLELALALKFLSTADQVYHWNLLNRDVFLALWIVLFGLLGLYLLGKIKLSHDSELPFLSVPRLLLATAALGFTVYLVPGLFGAPLAPLAGFLPPQTSLPFDLTRTAGLTGAGGPAGKTTPNSLCEPPRYADFLHLPHELPGYFDLEQARRCARAQNKPIFIDFTGHGCVNCREMEARVWSDPEVPRRLRDEYVIVALYVDDKTDLPAAEQVRSPRDQQLKATIGARNFDLQISRFHANAQPYYVLLDPADDQLRPLLPPRAYDLDAAAFARFLDAGVAAYHRGNSGAKR